MRMVGVLIRSVRSVLGIVEALNLWLLLPVSAFRPSALAAREKAMVVNLEFIKAIVIAEEVLLLDPLRHEVLPFVDQLRQQLPDRSQVKRYPMEFEKQSDWFTCTCTKDLSEAHGTRASRYYFLQRPKDFAGCTRDLDWQL